jgi:hypothetical protein
MAVFFKTPAAGFSVKCYCYIGQIKKLRSFRRGDRSPLHKFKLALRTNLREE